MTTAIIQNFEKMLADGKNSTMLRFSLGNEYLKAGDPARRSRPPAEIVRTISAEMPLSAADHFMHTQCEFTHATRPAATCGRAFMAASTRRK